MINGGHQENKHDAAIKAYLAEFDNDATRAEKALREYIASTLPVRTIATKARAIIDFSKKPVLLETQHLCKHYKRGKQVLTVLDDVSLSIHQGEFIAITGASGSGKSTLLQLLGGLDKPTSGDVLIDGTSLKKLSDGKLSAFRRKTVGFVFQFFYLQPFLRLRQNLEVPGMFERTKRAERARRVAELADKVGLVDRLNHLPRELSGGQMQRAAIARALLNSPKILLADEPTGNLDSQNGLQIIELFETIRRDLGTTIVIVTHDPSIAARADRVITVADGRIV